MITGKAEIVKWSIREVQRKGIEQLLDSNLSRVNSAQDHGQISDVNTIAWLLPQSEHLLLIFPIGRIAPRI